jgi:hypothetical protein
VDGQRNPSGYWVTREGDLPCYSVWLSVLEFAGQRLIEDDVRHWLGLSGIELRAFSPPGAAIGGRSPRQAQAPPGCPAIASSGERAVPFHQ